MLENTEFSGVVDTLTKEFDALIEERSDIRKKMESLKTRADEIDRKVAGIQKTLQGLSLYANDQEKPTELTKKTTVPIEDLMRKMTGPARMVIAGPDPHKTLTECCRDILREKQDW